ncbi:hypothetical protein IHE47_17645 [Rhodanobacter sp. DHB23]|nr:hypothetical protein [Rhodanobacter sp. DHB23]
MFKQRRTAGGQLGKQVPPFVMDLASGDDDGLDAFDRPYLRAIERIPAGHRLRVNPGEVGIDRQARLRMRSEAFELRMMPVPARFPAQDCPRQQPLAPQRDEALGVQVSGVQ